MNANSLRATAFLSLLGLAASSAVAQGAEATAVDAASVLGMLKSSMAPAVSKLSTHAISWLGAFASLQFFITNYKLLTSDGDLQAGLANLVKAVAWVGICLVIIQNGPSFLSGVGDSFFGMLGVDLPSPGTIMNYTLGASASMAGLALGVGSIPIFGGTAGLLLVCMTLLVLGVGMYFAFKIFMLQLELALIVMLSPLSFAFLGLNTLRDQGIAPFKALLSLAYRIILLTIILSAFGEVSNVLESSINGIDKTSFFTGYSKATSVILSAASAYLLLCYLVFKSDSIAASLASGTTSMGTGDVASAAAAGAAMGAAVASGGVAAAGAASAAPQSIRDFMGSLGGGGGSVRNASAMGRAEPPPLPSPGGSASFSTGSPSGGSAVGASGTGGPSGQARTSAIGSPSMDGAAPQSQGGSPMPDAGADSSPGTPAAQQAQSVATGKIGPDLSGQSGGQGQGSGQSASISGAGGGNDMADLSKAIGSLAEQVARGQAPRKPGLQDRLADANRHMEKEQDRVQVSINPHHHD